MALVGSNLPKIFWCKGGFEAIIIFWDFAFSCGVGVICDLVVVNLRGAPSFGGGGGVSI